MKRDMLTGRTLGGKYRLGRPLEHGGTGRVYRATQLSLDREVAVEIFKPVYASVSEAIARFRQEASAVSRLRHPGLAMVLDSGQDPDGLFYLVTEALTGKELLEIARSEAPLRPGRIARLMEQVALALAHAHEHGVVYRAVTPENIRVVRLPPAEQQPREVVKIAWTADAALHGTVFYMSPEQASGGIVCPQTDLYACGVILFLLATGRLPFSADSPLEIAQMHIGRPVPRPSHCYPQIDRRLEQIILRCMEKKPAARPASAAALARMLESISEEGELVRAPRTTAAEHARHSMLLWTTGVASALLTFASANWLSEKKWSLLQSRTPPAEVDPTRAPAVGLMAPASSIQTTPVLTSSSTMSRSQPVSVLPNPLVAQATAEPPTDSAAAVPVSTGPIPQSSMTSVENGVPESNREDP